MGLEDALHGASASLPPNFFSFRLIPQVLVALAEAFPDSDEAATAALAQYRVEQEIVPREVPKAELSSGELTALVKGRLHPVAKLGGRTSPGRHLGI
jgi:hypothetical protein